MTIGQLILKRNFKNALLIHEQIFDWTDVSCMLWDDYNSFVVSVSKINQTIM